MAVKIDVPTGVADWVNYLNTTWLSNFLYDGHGEFSPEDPTYTQWAAGNSGTSQSAALLEGDFSYQPPGGFTGDVDSLSFGSGLTGNASDGFALSSSSTVLTLDLSEATASTLFTYVIYNLSNNQSLTTLWSYLGEQGTEQTGNNGAADTLYSFSGSDTLTGGTGADTFVFDTAYYSATTGWGTDTITDFTDGTDKIKFVGEWESYSEFIGDEGVEIDGNVITFDDGAATTTITLAGFAGTLDSSDFLFA